MSDIEHDCHGHGGAGIGGVHQTMDEMDFQRGPWSKACDGDYSGIYKYLENGGNPSIPDSAGYTPLHYAARYGDEKITKLLLERGGDVDAITRAGHVTALHRATKSSIVQLLLQYNADPCAQDKDGKTPLHCAVQGGQMEKCGILLKHSPQCGKILDKNSKVAEDYIHEEDRSKFLLKNK